MRSSLIHRWREVVGTTLIWSRSRPPGIAREIPEPHAFAAKPRCSWPVTLLSVLCTLLFLTSGAMAQAQELFTGAARLSEATPAQTQAIEKLRQRATTQSLDLVNVNIGALRGDATRFSIPNVPPFTMSKRNEDVRGPNDFTWYGTLTGLPGQATLVVRDGNITGSIQAESGLYRIEPVGNTMHALIKVDRSRFPPEHPPSMRQIERRGDIRLPAPLQDAGTRATPVGIDVLVAYTTAARNAVADINATIQLAVAETNQSYVNSNINIKLTLVDSFEVAYSEAGKSFDTILSDFVANATVQSRRNSSGADLAAMIIDQTDYCGLADAIMATASTAFAIVHYDCATGYYSFGHELGHLMGARHDELTDPNTAPFAYGHGLRHTTAPSWRTIMAYDCPAGCPRLQYWSNPNVQYGGVPMGTAAVNDNARVLNQTATTVAGFRSPVGEGSGWHHNDLSNAAGAPAAVGEPAGYMFDAQGTQHVVYRGSDNHMHELWWNNSGWHHNDLTNAAGGAPPVAGKPSGYMFAAQGTQHVVYRGTDNRIHELWWNSSGWHHNDLTNAAGAPAAAGDPAGYMFAAQGTQHVVYRGSDNHIHELWWNGSGWHHNDLTNAAGGAPAAAGDPAGYMFDAQGTQHVVYRGTDNHIHELWWNSAGWHHNDLTNAAGGAPAAAGDPAGYMFAAQGTQHVVYRGSGNHVHELWWNSAGWHHNDLTNAAGGAPAAAGDPAGYMFAAQGTQHVVYRGTDSRIHELWWSSSGWHHNDLTAAAGGAPAAASDPAGYMFNAQNTQHVVYRGTDNHIHELWWD